MRSTPSRSGPKSTSRSQRRQASRGERRLAEDALAGRIALLSIMLFSAPGYVAATALLCVAASFADAQPSAVSPFPRDLSGTLAFQSDVRTASNPNGRVKLYTIDLATGRVATLTREGDWNDEQPRWSPDGATNRVQVESQRQLQPLRDGCRRPQSPAADRSRRQRLRSVVAARRRECRVCVGSRSR